MLTKEQKEIILSIKDIDIPKKEKKENTLKGVSLRKSMKVKKLDTKLEKFFSNLSIENLADDRLKMMHTDMLKYYKIKSKKDTRYYKFDVFKDLIKNIKKTKISPDQKKDVTSKSIKKVVSEKINNTSVCKASEDNYQDDNMIKVLEKLEDEIAKLKNKLIIKKSNLTND